MWYDALSAPAAASWKSCLWLEDSMTSAYAHLSVISEQPGLLPRKNKDGRTGNLSPVSPFPSCSTHLQLDIPP